MPEGHAENGKDVLVIVEKKDGFHGYKDVSTCGCRA